MSVMNENIFNAGKSISTSFYIADIQQFDANYERLLNAFKKHYKNTKIAYSYKTNYLPDFCKLIMDKGGYAEVVSDMEYYLACRLGNAESDIFFNGPQKNIDAVLRLLNRGGTVNLDSFAEYSALLSRVKEAKRNWNVGVRCNFDLSEETRSRFGFDAENGDLDEIIRLVSNNRKMQLVSLHCHFASRNLESWKSRAHQMVTYMESLHIEILNKLKFVSFGGGMYGEMVQELRDQFHVQIPSFDDYAHVSAKLFNQLIIRKNLTDLCLLIEPGTALAANSLKFIVKVVSIKKVGSEQFITVNGSIFNIGKSKNKIKLPIKTLNFSEPRERTICRNAKIVGYTCIEGDILLENYNGALKVGDLIVFDEVGSYSIVMKPPFIQPNVPIICFRENNKTFEFLKRLETADDVFITYLM